MEELTEALHLTPLERLARLVAEMAWGTPHQIEAWEIVIAIETQMPRGMTRPNKPVSGVQIACFDLCQAIGMEIEGYGQRITSNAVHFPATNGQVKSSLERLKLFADNALMAIDAAQADWKKEHLND